MAQKYRNAVKFFILLFFLVSLWYWGRFFQLDSTGAENYLSAMPLLAASLAYIILYVVITFFVFFSKDIFWIVAAVVFGPVLSALLIYISEIINVFILFFLARGLGRGFVRNYLKNKPVPVGEKLGNINFIWLFMLRVVPLVPYRFLDLGFGLTDIRFGRYLWAALLATPVRVFWIQYILAGVGKGFISHPRLLVDFLLNNRFLYVFSFIYLVLVFIVIFKFRERLK
jgi:uncharacterized membrane protein YdjX (TVP38/TMEM64 family)